MPCALCPLPYPPLWYALCSRCVDCTIYFVQAGHTYRDRSRAGEGAVLALPYRAWPWLHHACCQAFAKVLAAAAVAGEISVCPADWRCLAATLRPRATNGHPWIAVPRCSHRGLAATWLQRLPTPRAQWAAVSPDSPRPPRPELRVLRVLAGVYSSPEDYQGLCALCV